MRVVEGAAALLIVCVTESATAETTTTTGVSIADATYNKLRFEVNGVTDVKFYIDDVLVATHTANIPTGALAPSFEAGGTATAAMVYLDYIYAAQER